MGRPHGAIICVAFFYVLDLIAQCFPGHIIAPADECQLPLFSFGHVQSAFGETGQQQLVDLSENFEHRSVDFKTKVNKKGLPRDNPLI
jgi:hypothetical protein